MYKFDLWFKFVDFFFFFLRVTHYYTLIDGDTTILLILPLCVRTFIAERVIKWV